MSYKKVSISNAAREVKDLWTPLVLGSVEDYEIKLVVFEGKYFRHRHVNHDEFLYVVKGKIAVDLDDKTVHVKEGEGILIEKDTPHWSKATKKSVILVFERNTIYSDFVREGDQK
jgi:mannose-6-phosphate isomerase-like protein (cupin superfamily)